MKNMIFGGLFLAAGIAIIRTLLDRRASTEMEQKIHNLQEKFKSLDAQAADHAVAS